MLLVATSLVGKNNG